MQGPVCVSMDTRRVEVVAVSGGGQIVQCYFATCVVSECLTICHSAMENRGPLLPYSNFLLILRMGVIPALAMGYYGVLFLVFSQLWVLPLMRSGNLLETACRSININSPRLHPRWTGALGDAKLRRSKMAGSVVFSTSFICSCSHKQLSAGNAHGMTAGFTIIIGVVRETLLVFPPHSSSCCLFLSFPLSSFSPLSLSFSLFLFPRFFPSPSSASISLFPLSISIFSLLSPPPSSIPPFFPSRHACIVPIVPSESTG